MNATETAALKTHAAEELRRAVQAGADARALAEAIGRKPEAIGRYLAGQSLPPPRVAERILKAVKRFMQARATGKTPKL